MIVYPVVHSNGTSKNDLLEQHINVLNAIRELSEAMADAMPHGRDYYVHYDPDAFSKAVAQHLEMAKHLKKMLDHFSDVTQNIVNQRGQNG